MDTVTVFTGHSQNTERVRSQWECLIRDHIFGMLLFGTSRVIDRYCDHGRSMNNHYLVVGNGMGCVHGGSIPELSRNLAEL